MRVLVAGAGRIGASAIKQLQKNGNVTIITADPNLTPFAVQKGIITAVDIQETLTPLTLDYILEKAQPDLVLLTRSTEDLRLGSTSGLDLLAEALRTELAAIADVPMIEVARTASR